MPLSRCPKNDYKHPSKAVSHRARSMQAATCEQLLSPSSSVATTETPTEAHGLLARLQPWHLPVLSPSQHGQSHAHPVSRHVQYFLCRGSVTSGQLRCPAGGTKLLGRVCEPGRRAGLRGGEAS